MKLLKKLPLADVATCLIPTATQNNDIFHTCVQVIKGIIKGKLSIRQLFSVQSWQPIVIEGLGEGGLLKYPKINFNSGEIKTINNQVPLTDHNYRKQQTNTTSKQSQNRDWTPLIKVNAADQLLQKTRQYSRYFNKKIFAGKYILCVGGRAALYPEYQHIIATLGGNFLIYRGSLENNLNRLYSLLEKADMIICPVDCVNHNDFHAVKFYCKFSGKPHTLLDRSNLATFNKGVHILAKFACQHRCLPDNYQAASI